jgi:SP family sugar:H+ symporter-like MFS transporter
MSCWALVTATIAVTSSTRDQILAARILNCKCPSFDGFAYLIRYSDIYIGMELSVVPVFQSEIVPAPVRGFVVATYQLSLIVSILDPSR